MAGNSLIRDHSHPENAMIAFLHPMRSACRNTSLKITRLLNSAGNLFNLNLRKKKKGERENSNRLIEDEINYSKILQMNYFSTSFLNLSTLTYLIYLIKFISIIVTPLYPYNGLLIN